LQVGIQEYHQTCTSTINLNEDHVTQCTWPNKDLKGIAALPIPPDELKGGL